MPAFKSLILVDNLYLLEATAVFGHAFIGFLCIYLYCRIRQAGITAHLSPQGLLLKLSKVYAVESREERQIIVVLKQIWKIGDTCEHDSLRDEAFEFDHFVPLWKGDMISMHMGELIKSL
jgi:hypothetical protein